MSDDLAERCVSLGRVLEEQWLVDAGHEIERLRTRLKWFEDAGGVAVTTKVYQQAAEIERLRGLLREIAQEPFDSEPYLGADLSRRIREALGDE